MTLNARFAAFIFVMILLIGLLFSTVELAGKNSNAGIFVGSLFSILLAMGIGIGISASTVRDREVPLRMAITGRPEAGKTVLANIMFDKLMSAPVSCSISFTADSATTISVYRTMRSIEDNKWPKTTGDSVVNKYLGKLAVGPARRARRVSLEIGDSAGEHWLDFSERSNDLASRDRSPYIEYVISSAGIIHVIEAEELQDLMTEVWIRRHLEDLRLVTRLMKASGKALLRTSILLAVTKCDDKEDGGLHSKTTKAEEFAYTSARRGEVYSVESLQTIVGSWPSDDGLFADGARDLLAAAKSLSDEVGLVEIMFSSAHAVGDLGLDEERADSSLARWFYQAARTARPPDTGGLGRLIGLVPRDGGSIDGGQL